jgi:HK97 family phage major capsid protein
LESQVLNGDGTTPNLKGTLDLDSINTQAKGSDPGPNAVYKTFTKIRTVGFAEPDVTFWHPNDWQEIRLLTTADGVYIFGSPMDAGPKQIWGVPVAETTAVTEGTVVSGSYRPFSNFYLKRGIEFAVTDSHDDYFIKGKQAIRASVRGCMVHYREPAFGKTTGM